MCCCSFSISEAIECVWVFSHSIRSFRNSPCCQVQILCCTYCTENRVHIFTVSTCWPFAYASHAMHIWHLPCIPCEQEGEPRDRERERGSEQEMYASEEQNENIGACVCNRRKWTTSTCCFGASYRYPEEDNILLSKHQLITSPWRQWQSATIKLRQTAMERGKRTKKKMDEEIPTWPHRTHLPFDFSFLVLSFRNVKCVWSKRERQVIKMSETVKSAFARNGIVGIFFSCWILFTLEAKLGFISCIAVYFDNKASQFPEQTVAGRCTGAETIRCAHVGHIHSILTTEKLNHSCFRTRHSSINADSAQSMQRKEEKEGKMKSYNQRRRFPHYLNGTTLNYDFVFGARCTRQHIRSSLSVEQQSVV